MGKKGLKFNFKVSKKMKKEDKTIFILSFTITFVSISLVIGIIRMIFGV